MSRTSSRRPDAGQRHQDHGGCEASEDREKRDRQMPNAAGGAGIPPVASTHLAGDETAHDAKNAIGDDERGALAAVSRQGDPRAIPSGLARAAPARRPRGRPPFSWRRAETLRAHRLALGRSLRALRERLSLSLPDAARALGMDQPATLRAYERGICRPPGDIVIRIARLYAVPAPWLADLVLRHADPDLHRAMHTSETSR